MIKAWIRKMIPSSMLDAYHRALALGAARFYGKPSEEMIVIGVTGTSGKTTTCFLLARALEACGAKVGLASTMLFKVGEREWLNAKKMTMLGRFELQHLLREMADDGCRYAIVETTSEGIKQFRHLGIHYDVCVFTNLYPEHIESHGSFEAYKAEKMKLFAKLAHDPHKILDGVRVKKIIVANMEDPQAKDFLAFAADEKVEVFPSREGLELLMPGAHNIANVALALHTGVTLGFPRLVLERALSTIRSIPGRLEHIDEGQPFTVIVDYAFEPRAMQKLYEYVATIPHERVIHVLGSTGGGRDTSRRSILGRMAGEHADVVIVTNEDPYDENPRAIMEAVAIGVREARNKPCIIEDRAEAIRQAIKEARPNDVVLVTGKGCEQAMVLAGGRRIPWDDRLIVREALHTL